MIKTYEAIFDEEHNTGVYGISLVENPAMEGLFVALNKETIQFKEVNKEERKVVGLVLEPNKPIYRNNNGEEYNIIFKEDTIKNLSYNFFKQNFQKNSTIEHEDSAKIENVTFVESWIVEDVKTDKQQLYGFNYPKGSWLAVLKIDNEEIWQNYVKTGSVKGFSIDGLLSLKEVKMAKNYKTDGTPITFSMMTKGTEVFYMDGLPLENGKHQLMTDIEIEVLDGKITDLKEINLNKSNMSKEVLEEAQKQTNLLTQILSLFKKDKKEKEEEVKLGSVKTADGSLVIEYDGEELVAGINAWIMAEDGTKVPVPIGEHPIEGDKVIVVTEDGVIAEVKDAMQPEAPAGEPMSEQAKSDADVAKEIENAIKSILIKYEAQEKKLAELEVKFNEVVKDNEVLKIALSEEPAKKPFKSQPTQVDLSKMTKKERLYNKIQGLK